MRQEENFEVDALLNSVQGTLAIYRASKEEGRVENTPNFENNAFNSGAVFGGSRGCDRAEFLKYTATMILLSQGVEIVKDALTIGRPYLIEAYRENPYIISYKEGLKKELELRRGVSNLAQSTSSNLARYASEGYSVF